jgi:septal ring-binding cell division protein DamX
VTLADARAFLRSGRNAEAAAAFASVLKSGKGAYTIQLMVACVDESVQKAVTSVSAEEFYILPARYSGRDCYRLCWGIYDSEAKANGAVKGLPGYFREGGAKPKAISAASVLP